MERYLGTTIGVFIAATLTTACCMIVAVLMAYFLFQGQDMKAALQLAPVISFVTAYPVSFFIWFQVRRNIVLGRELRRLVNRDRLTDVATRDCFFAKMKRDRDAFGVSLMVDIDLFKVVNDTYGHLAGDAVITHVARILTQNTRAKDIVCRFGGEEFVVFLFEQQHSGGYRIAERMRTAIAAEVMQVHGRELKVTVSIGGSMKERLEDVNLAIQQADEALYQAKNAGRNCTVFASANDETTDHVPV